MSSSFAILILTRARGEVCRAKFNVHLFYWDEYNVSSWMLTFLFISQEYEETNKTVKGNAVIQVCYNESYDNRKLLRK